MSAKSKKGSTEKKLGAGGKGLPIPKNANQIAMAGGPDATDRTDVQLADIPLRSRQDVDEQHPTAAHISKGKEDEKMAMKMELQAEGMKQQVAAGVAGDKALPGVTPFGILQAKESDFTRLQQIREKELEVQFEQWFASNYDKMGPEQKALARKLYNKFYLDRKKNAKDNLDLLGRLVIVKIDGPKTREDLELLFAAETGLIDTNFAENILHPERAMRSQNEAKRQGNFSRGIFNPRRNLRGDWGGETRFHNAQAWTGKTAGLVPRAATFGTGDQPFSVAGPGLDEKTEQLPNFANVLKQLQD